jgi:hypothetical protein
MKVAIIGAGRNRNGIGKYIGKYFQKNGVPVISVLATTEKTSYNASSALKQYGINAAAYTDFNRMVEKENPDAIVIASPYSTHYEYLIKSIKAGLHIFCEKPFICHEIDDVQDMLKNIFKMAESKNVKIAMNSQWPFSLPYYEELCGSIDRQKIDTFFIGLSPMFTGREMILDSVPHALSILYCTFGNGEIVNLDIEHYEEKMIIKFNYSSNINTCKVLISLIRKERQPRDFSFGFNDKIVKRSLDLESYDIYFNYADKFLRIADPLELSVQNFISAVREKREPLIGNPHIVSNTIMTKQIFDSCETM